MAGIGLLMMVMILMAHAIVSTCLMTNTTKTTICWLRGMSSTKKGVLNYKTITEYEKTA